MLLILVGIVFGIYLVLFLGVLLLIPAALSSARLPSQRTPIPQPEEPAMRIIPPMPARPAPSAQEPQPMATSPMYTPIQYQGYSGPLFPAPMFPSLSQMGAPPTTAGQAPPSASQGRDELLEAGAILAVLKLLSG